MKGVQILLGAHDGRDTAALVIDGTLEDLLIDSDAPRPGALYRAKAIRPVKGQGGMFFETPDGTAFLRGAKGISAGDTRLVQVSGYAEAGKAIPVTTRILFKSRYAIVTPENPGINLSRAIRDEEARVAIRAAAETDAAEDSGFGIILRSACAQADPDDIAEDVDRMVGLAQAILNDTGTTVEKLLEGPAPHDLAWRDWPAAELEEGDIAPFVDQALRPDLRLKTGGTMWVETTRALVAVDVDTGGDISPAAGLKANLAMAQALPRALRVRGLGGQIVIDPAPMPKKDRKQWEAALRAAFRRDDVETSLVGWTPMGHFELSRKRARPALQEVVS